MKCIYLKYDKIKIQYICKAYCHIFDIIAVPKTCINESDICILQILRKD